MDQIRVVIADDHPLYREGVARSLSDAEGITVVGEGQDADSAVELTEAHRPDVVLLDLSMPGGGGLAALRRIVTLPDPPVVAMLTVSEDDDDVMQALKTGAKGYVLKGVGSRDLVAIVRDLARGQSYVSPALAARILNAMRDDGGTKRPANPIEDLSRREEDILKLVAAGKSNKEVGLELSLQEKTVKHYMTTILQKLHVRNRVEAAVMARDYWKK
ncbi:response regulator transcription factor [Defluviimonas aestuarii]|uniref:response regulator n=1 Tax=Albidovulum aestuarii TaxID=1130726 RepID=UPI00249BBB9F|nr:response regulator transcription factor [Defluviimonas aestuarii]MDI3338567.1 response regulator transcription factor [Defluviimonas aestuarii]